MAALTRRGQDVVTVVLAAAGIGLLSVVWAATAPGDDTKTDQAATSSAEATPTQAPAKTPAANQQGAFVEDFEDGLDQWDEVGSAAITDETAAQGRRSVTLTSTECGGDAVSRAIPVEAGSTYRLRTDYRTDGDGGYIGLDLYDADGKRLPEKWLIGDGGSATIGDVRWDFNVDQRDAEDLVVWARYTARYTIPDGVASVRLKLEDWGCGGLPDDPATAPVFFDRIRWTLDSKRAT